MDNREIVFGGIAFRSRLEAQWALFFDTLGITYRYETKAHIHEEADILPSFYLPKYHCFIMVKEDFLISKEVSDDEEEILEEMKLLTLYEGKAVYAFTGNVWLPGEPDSYESHSFHPPTIWTYPSGQMLGSEPTTEIPASLMVKLILQKLEDCSMTASIQLRQLMLSSTKHIYQSNIEGSMKEYLEYMLYQHKCLTQLAPLVAEHYYDLVTVLTPKQDMAIEFLGSNLIDMPYVWAECSKCRDLSLVFHSPNEEHMLHRECQFSEKGMYKVNSPRLLNAYSIARKGDFEEYF